MGRWSRLLAGQRTDDALRARIATMRADDPQAWAYLATAGDDDTCAECRAAAAQLDRVDLRDPRLMVLLHGHPNCTGAHGCRCSIVVVGSDEPDPVR